jgi:HTH-type transcriptional regulator/antitoxin HigA
LSSHGYGDYSREAHFSTNRCATYLTGMAKIKPYIYLIDNDYEDALFPIKKASGLDVLKFLMDQNNLKQKDIVGILGGKSEVSEILNDKRPLNLKHIRSLSEKFNVTPASFV